MKYAWNINNVADMRISPDHLSERVSQILFAEVVEIISERKDFYKIRQSDGYSGWIGKSYLRPLLKKEAGNFLRREYRDYRHTRRLESS